jgi:hypothetical protein
MFIEHVIGNPKTHIDVRRKKVDKSAYTWFVKQLIARMHGNETVHPSLGG